MGSQQFCLRWNNHQTNLVNVFEELLTDETLVDVTLACEGLCVRAHKVVLSACSPYFKEIFVHNPCKHPIVIMKDINFAEMRAIIEFMYKGEVNISHEQLPAFLKTAETLKVKGLAEVRNEQKTFAHEEEEESREIAQDIEPTISTINNNNVISNNNNTPVVRSAPEVVTHPPPERNSPSPKRKRRNGRNVSESSEANKSAKSASEGVEILPEIIKVEADEGSCERDDEIPMVEEIARGVMGDGAQNKMANQEDSSNSFIQVDPADMPSFVTDQSWDDQSNSGNHLQPTPGGSGIQSTPQAAYRKRKAFSLEEKIMILKDVDATKRKQDVATKWEISSSTLSTLIKRREEVETAFFTSETDLKRKRLRKSFYPDLESALKMWLDDAHSRNIVITGELIKEKALQLAAGFGYNSFTASCGWLARFKLRCGIVCRFSPGETHRRQLFQRGQEEEVKEDWKL